MVNNVVDVLGATQIGDFCPKPSSAISVTLLPFPSLKNASLERKEFSFTINMLRPWLSVQMALNLGHKYNQRRSRLYVCQK
mmetsp:Transcript_13225/g.20422  ORF Transcript_13225/g.20422 Transcript_13225/m.20422 type:complete len:81 (+) Transcript_13225:542-784(+)